MQKCRRGIKSNDSIQMQNVWRKSEYSGRRKNSGL